MNKIIIFILVISFLTPSVFALQQTTGKLNMTVMVGENGSSQYGLKNEENTSVTVKFNVTGEAAPYLQYPKELILKPNQFIYVNVNSTIPSTYNGSEKLNGTIYALKEGTKGGQVQLNVRLGKNINLIVTKPIIIKSNEPEPKKSGNIGITFIGIYLVYAFMTNKRKNSK